MRTKLAIAIAALALIAVAWTTSHRTSDPGRPTGTGTTATPSGDGVNVDIIYSPEKEPLLVDAIRAFNARKVKIDGRPVIVTGKVVSSGTAYTNITKGTLKPTIWSPSSSFWGRLVNYTNKSDVFADKNVSFVRTPLVIAMWKEQAELLGWPKKQFGWSDMLAWSRDPKVFTKLGRPEWGAFKMGHTNPDFSTSGLSAVAAEYYAATGKFEGLTVADLDKPGVRKQVVDLQRSVVHYGDTTLFFADQLRKGGPAYASAVAMEEVTLVDFNKKSPTRKLVAIYPKEGTFYSDNPLMIPNGDWVSDAQRKGAQEFITFLTTKEFQATVDKVGMRPGIADVAIGPDIAAVNGADPGEPKRVMAVPTPQVLATIKNYWHEDRKPADVLLVLDTSGSMTDEDKLGNAQRGLVKFIRQSAPQDRLGLIQFSTTPVLLQPLTQMTPAARNALANRVNGLFPDGGTAAYDAAWMAFQAARQGDPNHIKAVVLLTDGLDRNSQISLSTLINRFNTDAENATHPVRVFTISYGSDADPTSLKKIAEAGNGKAYEGTTDNIEQVYLSISSFF